MKPSWMHLIMLLIFNSGTSNVKQKKFIWTTANANDVINRDITLDGSSATLMALQS